MCTINVGHMIYGSWNIRRNRQKFLSFWAIFCPFSTLTTQKKNQYFEKMKNMPGYIIILHKYTINDNHMIYVSWDMKHDGQNFFVILDHFFPFYPLTTRKFKIWKKLKNWKKIAKDIIILHKCTKNHHHMLYCSWDMVCDRCSYYFLFWAIICPFTPLTAQKIKIFKKWKKTLEISSFYNSVTKIMIMCYTVPEIWCVTDVIFIFHFGLFIALLPP